MTHAARLLGAGKVFVGGVFLVAPALAREWAGPGAADPAAQVVTRTFAIRDAACGAGLLTAPNRDGDLRRWLLISSVCDAVDFAATLSAPPSRGRTVALAAASGATLLQLALAVRAAT